MENDYKRYKFDDILIDGVQQENHKLRQQLGTLQEVSELKEHVHNGILEQLKSLQKQNLILDKAAVTAYELVEQLKSTSQSKEIGDSDSIAATGTDEVRTTTFHDGQQCSGSLAYLF